MQYQDDIENALHTLQTGGMILYPTDTIWGIGCDATNPAAVEKIYQLKKRSDAKSMLVLLENPNLLHSYVAEVPEIAWQLIDVADKPMTIIYSGAKNLASNLIAADGSIGIRITTEKFTEELIRRFRKPIVSTSANISGNDAPKNFSEIDDIIKNSVDYVVQYRQDDMNEATPSSILKVGIGGQIEIIRK